MVNKMYPGQIILFLPCLLPLPVYLAPKSRGGAEWKTGYLWKNWNLWEVTWKDQHHFKACDKTRGYSQQPVNVAWTKDWKQRERARRAPSNVHNLPINAVGGQKKQKSMSSKMSTGYLRWLWGNGIVA